MDIETYSQELSAIVQTITITSYGFIADLVPATYTFTTKVTEEVYVITIPSLTNVRTTSMVEFVGFPITGSGTNIESTHYIPTTVMELLVPTATDRSGSLIPSTTANVVTIPSTTFTTTSANTDLPISRSGTSGVASSHSVQGGLHLLSFKNVLSFGLVVIAFILSMT